MKDEKYTFADFCGIMDKLMAEDGCPWDRVQTHQSLRQYMIEESYEVVDAIDQGDMAALCEELGDVLLEVVFHAKIAEKEGTFTTEDVTDGVSRKMIGRHRHIFGDARADTPEAVVESWEAIKKEEKAYKTHTENLRSVAKALPANLRAQKTLSRAQKSGLPVPETSGSLASTIEAAKAALDALAKGAGAEDGANEERYGAVMLEMAQISRFLEINPEFALTNAIETFINRFERIENVSVSQGGTLEAEAIGGLDS